MLRKHFLHKILILILFFSSRITLFAQVYNYFSIQIKETESNPSVLAAEDIKSRVQIIHENAFITSNPFMFNSVRYAKYLEKSFTGVGFSLNNTFYDKDIYYNHLSLSAGYRNMLFNEVAVRLGVSYKLSDVKAPDGAFDYLMFIKNDNIKHSELCNNLNVAMTFSYGLDKIYLSVGKLNLNILDDRNQSLFPEYTFLNAGNLFSLVNYSKMELSYTMLYRENKELKIDSYSHFINYKYPKIVFSRKSSMYLGFRAGYVDKEFYQFSPFVTYFRNKLALNISYNFHFGKENLNPILFETSQINIIFIL